MNKTDFDLYQMLEIKTPLDVVDIGAAMGEKPVYDEMIKKGYAKVTGFEPNANEIESLEKKYGETHTFLPYFVGDGKKATFYETNWNLTGSLFEPNEELNKKFNNLHEITTLKHKHSIKTHRLDDIIEVKNIDFLKIDVQGSELSIFKNAKNILSDALVIQTEVLFVELYKNVPMFADLDTYLRSVGFQFHTFLGFGDRCFKPLIAGNDLNKGINQHLWTDAVYVRDWMNPDLVTEEKLKKYAYLMHTLYNSFDLCILLLKELDKKTNNTYAEQYTSMITNNSKQL